MKSSFPKLLKATPLPGFSLALFFADGVAGKIDLSAWVGKGMFSEWKTNPDSFREVRIDAGGKLVWTADLEMDPDAFYLKLINKTFEQYAGNQSLLRHPH